MNMSGTIILYILLFTNAFTIGHEHDHSIWNDLLKKHVSDKGVVNYKGFIKDSTILNQYLLLLETHSPASNWTKEQIMSYWINAYNAYTVRLIIRNYPQKSIKDIGGKIPFVNSTWDIKFIQINNETLDLNNIEHSKLRNRFDDPRIHMALVCASKSCPILLNHAFVPEKLDEQLDQQSRTFLADPFRNKIGPNQAQVSMIFKWYSSDFKKVGGVKAFINAYSKNKISSAAKIRYLNYDWDLNE